MTAELEERIWTLSDEKYSLRGIQTKLREKGLEVSVKSISNVLNGCGKRREAKASGNLFKVKRKRIERTKAMVEKVRRMIDCPNPKSQNEMAKICNVSVSTINQTIHED